MKRNKNTKDINTNSLTPGNSLLYELSEKKKRLKVNVIESLVGIVLLGFCRSYLQGHPAEKVALFTGVDVIVQKVNIWFSASGDSLKQKYDLERSFEEVISMAEGSNCIDAVDIATLKRQYKILKGLSGEEFGKEKSIYSGIIGIAYRKIKSRCKK